MGLRIKNVDIKVLTKQHLHQKKSTPSPFTKAEYINNLPGMVIHGFPLVKRMSESRPNSPHKQQLNSLTETWEDDDLSSSGSLVQMTTWHIMQDIMTSHI